MSKDIIENIKLLALISKRSHYQCEDGYYSCPASEEGCRDERYKDSKECNCGAEDHNCHVEMIKNRILEQLKEPQ